jgi:outer membrane protein TolC
MRRDSLAAAVTAGRSAFELARFQYNSGLVSFQTVLDTQQSVLSTQDQLPSARPRLPPT